jgi:hypothetical protein
MTSAAFRRKLAAAPPRKVCPEVGEVQSPSTATESPDSIRWPNRLGNENPRLGASQALGSKSDGPASNLLLYMQQKVEALGQTVGLETLPSILRFRAAPAYGRPFHAFTQIRRGFRRIAGAVVVLHCHFRADRQPCRMMALFFFRRLSLIVTTLWLVVAGVASAQVSVYVNFGDGTGAWEGASTKDGRTSCFTALFLSPE